MKTRISYDGLKDNTMSLPIENLKKITATSLLISALIVLATILFGDIFLSHTDRKDTKAKFQIEHITNALERYYQENGKYPSTSQGLEILTTFKSVNGAFYLEKIISDPWSNPYHYISPGVHNKDSYDLWTFGADNKAGGKGWNKDISNW